MSNPIEISTAVSTDGGVFQISQLSQGVGNNQRIGSSVQLRRLKIVGQITMSAGGTPIVQPDIRETRLMLFYGRRQFTPADLLDYVTGSYDPKTFFPLHDRYYTVALDYDGSGAGNAKPRPIIFTISKVLRYYQKYSSPLDTDQITGFLTLVLNTPNNANTRGLLNARQEVWYDDV
jgi:hypothetical protein